MAIDEEPEGHEIDALRELIPSFAGLRVVEIGCGDGRLTRRYAPEAASVIAIDPDAEAVGELAGAFAHVDARAVGVDALDLPPHSADVVLFAWSL
jgi:16S rRNA A1518/A1519 N6-dimethyltransferase RsmA/KsgA/DIM1 with predicted DNA glycosylase/AP lyase activity